MSGTIYTFAGGKGGVGKTTVTANVATALSEEGYDVVAVDLDLGMTNLGQFMGESADCGVHQVLAGEADISASSTESDYGPTIVPGSARLDAVEKADPSNLKQVLDPLADRHDIVLLDTGAGLSHENCVAYGLADAVVLVSTTKQLAVEDIQKTREMIDRVEGTVGGLVLTRSHGDEHGADIETNLFGVIPEYGDADEPVVALDPESEVAGEYRRVATALAVYHQTGSREQALTAQDDRSNDESDTPDSTGLFGRVTDAFGLP
jgi:septum site-determining protein MinD